MIEIKPRGNQRAPYDEQFGFQSHQIYLAPITPCQLAWQIKMKFPKTTQVLRLIIPVGRKNSKKEQKTDA
jgi:hypothetical protein